MSEHTGAQLEVLQLGACKGGFGRLLYLDGSCSRPALPEFARASWAIVMTGEHGAEAASWGGAVPWPWPQTPQAAEW